MQLLVWLLPLLSALMHVTAFQNKIKAPECSDVDVNSPLRDHFLLKVFLVKTVFKKKGGGKKRHLR